MANTIIPKRSTVAGKVPAITDLVIGEIAINLTDKKIYTKDGTGNVVAIGGAGGASISISDTAPSSPTNGALWWNSNIGVLKIYYEDGSSTQWVDAINISPPQPVNTLEGGSASTRYIVLQNIDGGSASSIYLTTQAIANGGYANG